METDPPQVIRVKYTDYYDEIMEKGPFGDFEKPQIFLLAVSIGYARGEKEEGADDWVTRTEYLGGENSEERWLLRSIALEETDDITVLRDGKKIFDIAVQYANGGIQVLHDMVFADEPGSIEKRLEAMIREQDT